MAKIKQLNLIYMIIPNDSTPIVLNISDLTIDNTVIKRKAELFTMTYNQSSKELSLIWKVKHYSNNNGEYGEYIPDIAKDKIKETLADNSVMVSPVDGSFILPDEEGNYDENTPMMGQYDFFWIVAETQNIKVHDLIRAYGMQADWNFNLK